MRDLLIRYLLGELDDAAQRRLEELLQQSPELQRELEHLRACFSAADEPVADRGEPPSGLAERTSDQVTSLADGSLEALAPSRISSVAVESPATASSWSLADLCVAAGVFLSVSMLVLPALRGSRDTARRIDCANNQREIGQLLAQHAGNNFGQLPGVLWQDKAGIFAAILVDGGLIEVDDFKPLLLCRASKEGEAAAFGKLVLDIPTVQMLRTARGRELERLLRQMLYSYAYRIGYIENNQYHCNRKRRKSACEPLLADAPVFDALGAQIVNHDGAGFNLLYEDGHVSFRREPAIPGDFSVFVNLLNQAAAGRGRRDVVLGVSGTSPAAESSDAE